MLTGIEVIGLVFGALPIIISALENYENILGPSKAFKRYHGELSRATRELGNYYASYDQSIQLLLTPIMEPQKLNEMMENADNEFWKDRSIEEALKEKLGRSHDAYMRTVQEVESIMKSIAENLNIEGAEKVTHDGLEAIIAANPLQRQPGSSPKFDFRKRLKFTMKQQTIKKLLDALKSSISQLDTFLEKAEKLEEPYKANIKSHFVVPLNMLQKNAAKLHHVLSRSWCSVHPTHPSRLLLEQRLVTRKRAVANMPQSKASDRQNPNCFGISLLQSTSPNRWLEVEFSVMETPRIDKTASSKVSFSGSPQTIELPSLSAAEYPFPDPSQLQVVTNLCSIVKEPCHPRLGFCVDGDGRLRGVYPAQKHNIPYVEGGTGLDKIIANTLGSLKKAEVYHLSITLTSTLLQLSRTPWLQQSWNKADIVFLRAKDDSAATVDLEYPYLAREHGSNHIPLSHHATFTGKDRAEILALGIMLLEISCGQSIESLRQPDDLGPNNKPNEFTNFHVAHRWLKDLERKGDISFAFKEAISHCLKAWVDAGADLENVEFARAIEEQVLVPLEQEQNFLLLGPARSNQYI